jgi:type VI secretion system protein ImpM
MAALSRSIDAGSGSRFHPTVRTPGDSMPELGFFGKIPAKGDFVRHNVVDDAARSFEQWVQESNDALRGAGGELPDHPIRGVFTPPGGAHTILSVLVPSQDQVGRKFPIVIFALTPSAGTGTSYPFLPLAWSAFFEAAVALGKRAATLDVEQLKTAVVALPTAGPLEVMNAQQLGEKTLAHPLSSEIHQRIFGGTDGMHFYAYQTFLTACKDASKNDPGKPATVLDCPIHVDVDLFVWLELARRVFGFPPAHPSYFWIEDPAPRLLFSLGPAPLAILQFMANPTLEHQRLWPLTTQRTQAVDAAKTSLGPALAGVNEQAPLASWMETLVSRASSGTAR